MEIMKTDNSGLTHSSGAVVAEESIICAMLLGRIINCQNVFLRDSDEKPHPPLYIIQLPEYI